MARLSFTFMLSVVGGLHQRSRATPLECEAVSTFLKDTDAFSMLQRKSRSAPATEFSMTELATPLRRQEEPGNSTNETDSSASLWNASVSNESSPAGIDGRMASAAEEASYAYALARQAEGYAQEYREAKARAAEYAQEVRDAAEVVRRASQDALNASEITADATTVDHGNAGFINATDINATAASAEEFAETAQEAAARVNRALGSFRASEQEAKRAAAKGLGVAQAIDASIDRTLELSRAASEALEVPMATAKRIIAAPTTLLSTITTTTTTAATTTADAQPQVDNSTRERSRAPRRAGGAALWALAPVLAPAVLGVRFAA